MIMRSPWTVFFFPGITTLNFHRQRLDQGETPYGK
jgi:hypothetical protein